MGEFTHAGRMPKAPAPRVAEVAVDDLYSMLLGQIRYAMGRMSYIVGTCSTQVRRYWPHLEASERKVLLRDITEELARYEQAGKLCGMDMDHVSWVRLRDWMKEQVDG